MFPPVSFRKQFAEICGFGMDRWIAAVDVNDFWTNEERTESHGCHVLHWTGKNRLVAGYRVVYRRLRLWPRWHCQPCAERKMSAAVQSHVVHSVFDQSIGHYGWCDDVRGANSSRFSYSGEYLTSVSAVCDGEFPPKQILNPNFVPSPTAHQQHGLRSGRVHTFLYIYVDIRESIHSAGKIIAREIAMPVVVIPKCVK